MALTATKDDNGYVTMFFLLIPALSALISLMMSRWIPGLQFVSSAMFLVGLALVTISLCLLSITSWRSSLSADRVLGEPTRDEVVELAPFGAGDRGFRLPDQRGAVDSSPAPRRRSRSLGRSRVTRQ